MTATAQLSPRSLSTVTWHSTFPMNALAMPGTSSVLVVNAAAM